MPKVKETMALSRKKKITLVMALANSILNKLHFKERINESIKWDKSQWGISPGGLAKALVLSTFTDMRAPLSHTQDRLYGMDMTYLLGEDADAQGINEFNTGRALERIGESDYESIYENLALSAVTTYNIPVTRLHSDTTTISFYGEYDVNDMKLTPEEQEELIQIEKGYNKDGRPDSKQLIAGQIITDNGIPIVNRVLNGATSDADWNKEALSYLEEIRKKGFCQGIYVADSKLVFEEAVIKMCRKETRIDFVSRCPASFSDKLEERIINRAYRDEAWEDLGQISNAKTAGSYRGISYHEYMYGEMMRLVVLESSVLAEKAEESIEKKKTKLTPIIKDLEKKTFVCRADAEKEYARFIKQKALQLFECTPEITEQVTEKWPRGRRSATAQPTVTSSWKVKIIELKRNIEACSKHIRKESCYVLISNIADETVTARTLLEIYKGQHVVENSFRQLKGPNLASVIYLKNPYRICGLTTLFSFALLVRALIQHRLRDGLCNHKAVYPDEPIMSGWGGKVLTNPTFKLFYEHSFNCYYEQDETGEYNFVWPFVETRQIVEPLLKLMGESVASLLL